MKPRSKQALKTIAWISLFIAVLTLIGYIVSLQAPHLFGKYYSQVLLVFTVLLAVISAVSGLIAIYDRFNKPQPSASNLPTLPHMSYFGGDQISFRDITDSTGVAIGNHAQSFVTQISIQQSGRRSIPLHLPPRPPHLCGRDLELSTLLSSLHPSAVFTLCGPGGIGKTALASEALWQLTNDGKTPPQNFPDGVFFYSFYNQPSADLALEQLALAFGEDPLPTPETAARRALSNRCALIVLDGAEAADDLTKILGLRGRCAALITSRDRAHIFQQASLDLTPLEIEPALALLRDWGGEQVSNEALARKICDLVGRLPLAVQLAGHYLSTYKENLAAYAAWLENTPLAALDQGKRSHESVPILLERSLERVSEEARQALAVIGLLALAPFERRLVAAGLGVEESQTSAWLNDLLRYGLLQREEEKYLITHLLILTYARKKLALPENALSALSQAIVKTMDEIDVDRQPQLAIPLHPHLRSLAEANRRDDPQTAANLWNRLGYSLDKIASYTAARESHEKALAIRKEVLGEKHPFTAKSLNSLGALLDIMGDLQGARPYYERALAIRREVLGEKHPDTATSLNNLGFLLKAQGDLQGARPYLEQALAIRRAVLGEKHPTTAGSINNLGGLLQDLGDLQGARPYFEQALAINKEVLGEKHPATAGSLNNLGSLLQALGDLQGARPCYEQALTINKEVLGENHPDTATSLNNLGFLLQALGNLQGARPYYEQSLAIRREVLGEKHPHTAASLNNLGGLLYKMEDLHGARPYLEQALAIRREVLGEKHPDTARSLNKLGILLQDLGDLRGARPYLEQAMTILEQTLPPNHPDIQLVRRNLASLDK